MQVDKLLWIESVRVKDGKVDGVVFLGIALHSCSEKICTRISFRSELRSHYLDLSQKAQNFSHLRFRVGLFLRKYKEKVRF